MLPSTSQIDTAQEGREQLDDLQHSVDLVIRDSAWIRREVDVIEGVFATYAAGRVQRILDAPCGYGRHAVELASRGYGLHGVDWSPKAVSGAREYAERHGVAATFDDGDIRYWHAPELFDAALNWHTSIGYIGDDAEDVAILAATADALRAGGLLLLECEHSDNLVANFVAEVVAEFGGGVYEGSRTFERGRYEEQQRFTIAGTTHERTRRLRIYGLAELEALCEAAGLRVLDVLVGASPGMVETDRRALLVARRD